MPEVLTEVDLPDDWGLMKAVCADGKHRFLPDAPRCGCGEIINPEAELGRLEREVIEKARAFGRAWRARIQDSISSRHPSEKLDADATEKRIQLCDVVEALDRFESSQQQVKK